MLNIFELKSYQKNAITDLKVFIEKAHQFSDDLGYAFRKVQKKYPYHEVSNALGKPFPKICFKLPTGAGKTYLAAHSIAEIQESFYKRHTGLVVWVTTSDTIYQQTYRQLKDIKNPLHLALKNAAFGKLKVFNKESKISKLNLETHLCILVITIQSFNVGRETKDKRKIYDDSALYLSYFPEYTNSTDNYLLKKHFQNLDTFSDNVITYKQFPNTTIKHSLANLIRLEQPLFILDECHRQKTKKAEENIINFNPSFILELSATPSPKSSILYEAKGFDLWKEQMIKMPITVTHSASKAWQDCVEKALDQLKHLDKLAERNLAEDNIYIRPIMLIRVERTGKDQRDAGYIHAEDVKEYLLKQGFSEKQIAIKSSEKDDLEKINLLEPKSMIKVIITKHAIAEGWDCPFAYILCNLDNTHSEVALTQILGRILRQPYAKQVPDYAELNQCFVYVFDREVDKVTQEIKSYLSEHGYSDMQGQVSSQKTATESDISPAKKKQIMKIRRRKEFSEEKILLPKLSFRLAKNIYTEFNWTEHILPEIEWSQIRLEQDLSSYKTRDLFDSRRKIDYDLDSEELKLFTLESLNLSKYEFSLEPMQIIHKFKNLIPNVFLAYEILEPHLENLSKYADALALIEEMKKDIEKQIYHQAKTIFNSWFEEGKLKFSLYPEPYQIPSEIEFNRPLEESDFYLSDGSKSEKSLFEPIYATWFNELERSSVTRLERDFFSKLDWWHRIYERKDYFLQGWQKHRIYPDFLVKKLEDQHFSYVLIETKGAHLKNNEDTLYKKTLLDFLSNHHQKTATDETIEAFGFTGAIIDEEAKIQQLYEIMG